MGGVSARNVAGRTVESCRDMHPRHHGPRTGMEESDMGRYLCLRVGLAQRDAIDASFESTSSSSPKSAVAPSSRSGTESSDDCGRRGALRWLWWMVVVDGG